MVFRADGEEFVERLDFGRFSKVQRTPQGGLKVPANLTRVGVFVYTRADGSQVRELRPPEEVFNEDSLSTLAGAPVTDLHPSVPVRPDNWRDVTVGHVGEGVRADGKFVAAKLMIQDAKAIQRIERKEDSDPEARRELSCGYACRIDATPGEWNGEAYDVVQRNIRYNHVALGPKNWGRAGNEVALRLDAHGNQIATQQEVETMRVIRIDGVDYEYGSEAHINKLEEMHGAKLTKETRRADEAEGKLEAANTKNEELQAKLDAATDPATIDKRVTARADLVSNARRVLGDDYKCDGLGDREIMVAAIRHDKKDFDAEGKSDDYVRAYFDARTANVKRHDEGGNGVGAARSAATAAARKGREDSNKNDSQDNDENRVDANAARQRMIEANKKAATEPLRFSRS